MHQFLSMRMISEVERRFWKRGGDRSGGRAEILFFFVFDVTAMEDRQRAEGAAGAKAED